MERSTTPFGTPRLLGIYLNDHLAGATGGVELLRRAARAQRGRSRGPQLAELAEEVASDRAALQQIMADLGIPVQRAKTALGWLAEKAGRLKLNGHLLSRSPLSDVLDLEMMRLGVEGKTSCWRSLRAIADTDSRLDTARLDGLLQRAGRQAEVLEALRTAAAVETFGSPRD
ncbi:hypothetical protein ABZ707_06960 [Streptomyces sp. NPDC006923]|uniref:hypothetical protein n=1 Tax=Streptomyces sp. NPDC006923 TaxID=3155355 RepID=UPI003400264A